MAFLWLVMMWAEQMLVQVLGQQLWAKQNLGMLCLDSMFGQPW